MKEFQIGDSVITFSDEDERYRDLFVKYQDLANEQSAEFEILFESSSFVTESFTDFLQACFENCVSVMSDAAQADLVAYGVYDVSQSEFMEHYGKHLQERAIEQRLANALRNVTVSSATGSQDFDTPSFVGGGFGVAGAAQGIALATAANLAAGIIGSGFRRAAVAKAGKQFTAALKTRAAEQSFSAVVFDAALCCHHALLDCLLRRKPSFSIKRPDEQSTSRAKAIAENSARGILPADKEREMLISALQMDPYLHANYVLLAVKYSLSEEVDALAEYLELDLEQYADSADGAAELGAEIAGARLDDYSKIAKILERHSAPGLYLSPFIPDRKIKGARENYYFTRSWLTEAEHEDSANRTDLGHLLALIDCTLLGSASNGVAFGARGMGWRTGSSGTQSLLWDQVKQGSGTIQNIAFGVSICGKVIEMSSSKFKRDSLTQLLTEISDV